MTGFEHWTAGIGRNCSTNWATTTARVFQLFCLCTLLHHVNRPNFKQGDAQMQFKGHSSFQNYFTGKWWVFDWPQQVTIILGLFTFWELLIDVQCDQLGLFLKGLGNKIPQKCNFTIVRKMPQWKLKLLRLPFGHLWKNGRLFIAASGHTAHSPQP